MTSQQLEKFGDRDIETSGMEARTLIDRTLTTVAFLLLGIAILPLFLVIAYVTIKGLSRLNLDLLTGIPPAAMESGGGIGSAIAGTLLLVAIAAVVSIPFGIAAGIYLSEFSSKKIAKWIRFFTNVLSGVPSIIVGIFAYTVIVFLIHELKGKYTVIIVTHNMQQAARVADLTAFFNAREQESGSRFGYLVEYDDTDKIFDNPEEEATQKYVSGRFG